MAQEQEPTPEQPQESKSDPNREEAVRWGHVRTKEAAAEQGGVWVGLLGSLGCLGFAGITFLVILLAFLFIVVAGLFRGCAGGAWT